MTSTRSVTRNISRNVTRSIDDPGGWGGTESAADRIAVNMVDNSTSMAGWIASQEGGIKTTGQTDSQGGTDAVICPDNGATGTGTNRFLINNFGSVDFENGKTYNLAMDFKLRPAATFEWLRLGPSAINIAGVCQRYFDLSNGVTEEVQSTGTGDIIDLGGGWYRCWVLYTVDGADVTGEYLNSFMTSSAGSSASVCPLTGDEGYIGGRIQIEDVTDFADQTPAPYVSTP